MRRAIKQRWLSGKKPFICHVLIYRFFFVSFIYAYAFAFGWSSHTRARVTTFARIWIALDIERDVCLAGFSFLFFCRAVCVLFFCVCFFSRFHLFLHPPFLILLLDWPRSPLGVHLCKSGVFKWLYCVVRALI